MSTTTEISDQFSCSQCNYICSSQYRLRYHKRNSLHHYYCMKCDKDFATNNEMNEHFRGLPIISPAQDEQRSALSCQLCHSTFRSFESFNNHLTDRKHENICSVCYTLFHNDYQLEEHRRRGPCFLSPSILASLPRDFQAVAISQEKLLIPPNDTVPGSSSVLPPSPPLSLPRSNAVHFCGFCKQRFDTSLALNEHYVVGLVTLPNTNTLIKDTHCSLCRWNAGSLGALKNHLLSVIHRGHWICSICFASLHSPRDLERHRFHVHKVSRPSHDAQRANFRAGQVLPGLNSKTLKHISQSSDGTGLTTVCPRCQESFDTYDDLQQHQSGGCSILNLGNSDTMLCTLCKQNFPDKKKLEEHIGSSPEHRSSCLFCLLDFQSPSLLQEHNVTHHKVSENTPRDPTGIKSPEASSSRDSSVKANPNRVVTRPSARKENYYCGRCNLSFGTSQKLEEHRKTEIILVQGGSRLGITCKPCRKTYPNTEAMREHLSSTPAHEAACTSCLLDFHNLDYLEAHSNLKHAPATASHPASSQPSTLTAVVNFPVGSESTTPNLTHAGTLFQDSTPNSFPDSQSSAAHDEPHEVIGGLDASALESTHTSAEEEPHVDSSYRRIDDPSSDPWDLHLRPSHHSRSRNPHTNSYAGRTRRNVPETVVINPAQLMLSITTDAPASAGGHGQHTRISHSDVSLGENSSSATTRARPSAPRNCRFPIPCPLCLDLAVDLASTLCGHVGCEACLIQSLESKPECPVCRKPATRDQLHALYL